ncbi:ADAMTS-like protein 5 [Alligator mississippiensis]|uniref:ADAMTS-like protein 5 n=1 Tax=Alligator mississippiensis TaxID=8496 RepID=A0A151NCB4_ALLMI|nr:ADAMTS-like protein 5 [Alligator mississippiensis]
MPPDPTATSASLPHTQPRLQFWACSTDPSCPFPRPVGYFGYKNVTRIPAGATHIKVTDRSRNYLALMTAEQHYVINGDWAVDPPGVYEVAGTQVHYARAADERESLEAAGPTQEDLYVTVLFQEPNPGIEYEFWLPRGHDGHFQADVSPLRQPQPREAHMDPPRQPLPVPRTTPVPTPPSTRATAMRRPPSRTKEVAQTGRCGRCPMPKGRSKRIHHYCHSDFGKSPPLPPGAGTDWGWRDARVQDACRPRGCWRVLPRELGTDLGT